MVGEPGESAYPAPLLRRIAELCEADPAREACGFVVRRGDGQLEVISIPNVADRYHARDPARFPRSSRDGYLMDPLRQLQVLEDLEREGGRVVTVWHSHVEVGAYFSSKDRSDAVVNGVQLVPGAEYLVFGVRAGRVDDARRYLWDGSDFVESDLILPCR